MNAEIFLVHEHLEVEAIEARERVPVDVAEVVADFIGTVVGEFHARALAGTLALPLDATDVRAPGHEIQALELHEKVVREQASTDGRGGRLRARPDARAPGGHQRSSSDWKYSFTWVR